MERSIAPAATPAAVLDRLNKDVVAVMNTPDMKERMLMHAAEVRTSWRDAFTQFIREDFAKWAKLVKASGARSSESKFPSDAFRVEGVERVRVRRAGADKIVTMLT